MEIHGGRVKAAAGSISGRNGSGAVLLYRALVATSDPAGYLRELWNVLLQEGREHLSGDSKERGG